MLEPLRLGMHLVERQAERVREIALEQTVMAEHLERAAASGLREDDAAIRRTLRKAELCQALHHRGRRRSADTHPVGERGRRHLAPCGIQRVDRLQVVLNGG